MEALEATLAVLRKEPNYWLSLDTMVRRELKMLATEGTIVVSRKFKEAPK